MGNLSFSIIFGPKMVFAEFGNSKLWVYWYYKNRAAETVEAEEVGALHTTTNHIVFSPFLPMYMQLPKTAIASFRFV